MNTLKIITFFGILLIGLVLLAFLGTNREGLTTQTYTGPQGNSAGVVVGPEGNVYTGSNINGNKNVNSRTSYDNYNHYYSTSLPTIFYGPSGATAKLVQNNGVYSVIITDGQGVATTYTINTNTGTGQTTTINTNTDSAVTTYYGPNGQSATIVRKDDDGYEIHVTDVNGTVVVYSSDNIYTYDTDYVNNPPGYNPPGYNPPGNVGAYNPPGYNAPGYNPPGSSSGYNYANSLPAGIPRNQIPAGQEDLYILKSEVVPPVCPACPTNTSCPREEKCPPCPACARCPEPSFECKKVPNYSATNDFLPSPVLNDFSTFGM